MAPFPWPGLNPVVRRLRLRKRFLQVLISLVSRSGSVASLALHVTSQFLLPREDETCIGLNASISCITCNGSVFRTAAELKFSIGDDSPNDIPNAAGLPLYPNWSVYTCLNADIRRLWKKPLAASMNPIILRSNTRKPMASIDLIQCPQREPSLVPLTGTVPSPSSQDSRIPRSR